MTTQQGEKPFIIFDFDGVLVDTVELLEHEIRKKLTALGYSFLQTHEDFYELYDENLAVSLIERGVGPSDMCALLEHVQRVTIDADVKLCPGISEMLQKLAGKCEMAIVATNTRKTITTLLGGVGALSRFSQISGGDDDFGKVERIRGCMKEAHATAEKTFYVGDTTSDIREAHAAGVQAVAAAWGLYPIERLGTASPECIVRTPLELVELIEAFTAT